MDNGPISDARMTSFTDQSYHVSALVTVSTFKWKHVLLCVGQMLYYLSCYECVHDVVTLYCSSASFVS